MTISDIDKMEKEFRILKVNKEEIRLLELAIADKILDNNKRLAKLKEKDEIGTINLELNNSTYLDLLQILRYLER